MVATLALHMLIAFQELGWVSSCCGRVYSGGNVQIFSIDAFTHSILYFGLLGHPPALSCKHSSNLSAN